MNYPTTHNILHMVRVIDMTAKEIPTDSLLNIRLITTYSLCITSKCVVSSSEESTKVRSRCSDGEILLGFRICFFSN